MKHLALGITLLLGALSSAAAQSVPPSIASSFNQLAAPAYGWMGFYVGVNAGYSFGRLSTDFTVTGVPFASRPHRMNGALGGVQAGYNWRTGNLLFGFETDIQATGQQGGTSFTHFIPGTPGTPGTPGIPAIPCILFDPPAPACIVGTGIPAVPGTPAIPGTPALASIVSYQSKLPWFGTVRGRIGFTPAERLLIYATAGLAYGELSTTSTLNVNGANALLQSTSRRLGWTAGAGLETLVASGWTMKVEYLYIDFGDVAGTLRGIAPFLLIATDSHVTDHIVRIGFNYAFGSPSLP